MRKKIIVNAGSLVVAVSLLCGTAIAAETPKPELNASVTKSVDSVRNIGQDNFAELDAQAGAFMGLRLKAIVFSGDSYNLAIEGLAGGSTFANSALFPTTYGGGVRTEFYLTSGKSHAWMISPGLAGYYVPAKSFKASEPQDWSQAIGQALASALLDVPTRVVLVSPNVDINRMFQFSRHFGFVVGAKVGAAIALNGTNSLGESLAGKVNPDIGLYIGTRF